MGLGDSRAAAFRQDAVVALGIAGQEPDIWADSSGCQAVTPRAPSPYRLSGTNAGDYCITTCVMRE